MVYYCANLKLVEIKDHGASPSFQNCAKQTQGMLDTIVKFDDAADLELIDNLFS